MKKRIFAFFLMFVMVFAMGFGALPSFSMTAKAASITVDGDISDWSSVEKQSSSAENVMEWAVARDSSNLYFYAKVSGNQWWNGLDGNLITFSNGQMLQSASMATQVKDSVWADVSGASICASALMEDSYYYDEVSIPLSFLTSTDVTMEFVGTSMAFSDIPSLDGSSLSDVTSGISSDSDAGDDTDAADDSNAKDAGEEDADSEEEAEDASNDTYVDENTEYVEDAEVLNEDSTAVYSGIVIDGDFSDWQSVATPIYSVTDNSYITEVSAIWDGDYVYVYVKENPNYFEGNIAMAAHTNNGIFVLQTDKNRQTSFYFYRNFDGSIWIGNDQGYVALSGTDGAYSDHMYELAIPISQIYGGDAASSINFGIYNATDNPLIYVSGLTNRQGTTTETVDSGKGIAYDYDFSDWDSYGASILSGNYYYDSGANGASALYYSDGIIYGHVEEYSRSYSGNDMTPFYLAINGNHRNLLGFSAWQVDSYGNVGWRYDDVTLPVGSYEYYLFDDDFRGGRNISNSRVDAHWYGKIYIVVNKDGSVECEFYIDAEKVAEYFGVDITDLKKIEGRFPGVGRQWVALAGTSSGAVVGILLCIAVVGSVRMYKKRKKNQNGMVAC